MQGRRGRSPFDASVEPAPTRSGITRVLRLFSTALLSFLLISQAATPVAIATTGYDTLVVSADKDVARQGNQLKDFIVRKVAAIVLSPCESRSIVPSCSRTMPYEIDSPSPVPCPIALVVKNGS